MDIFAFFFAIWSRELRLRVFFWCAMLLREYVVLYCLLLNKFRTATLALFGNGTSTNVIVNCKFDYFLSLSIVRTLHDG